MATTHGHQGRYERYENVQHRRQIDEGMSELAFKDERYSDTPVPKIPRYSDTAVQQYSATALQRYSDMAT